MSKLTMQKLESPVLFVEGFSNHPGTIQLYCKDEEKNRKVFFSADRGYYWEIGSLEKRSLMSMFILSRDAGVSIQQWIPFDEKTSIIKVRNGGSFCFGKEEGRASFFLGVVLTDLSSLRNQKKEQDEKKDLSQGRIIIARP